MISLNTSSPNVSPGVLVIQAGRPLVNTDPGCIFGVPTGHSVVA